MLRHVTRSISLVLMIVTAATAQADLPPGWSNLDIGSPTTAGSTEYDETTLAWTIQADGTGIMGTADQFHYAYKSLSGDGELIARVARIEPAVDDWAAAGIMMRLALIPNSPYVFMGVTANASEDHGVTFMGRTALNGAVEHASTGDMTAPYWVRLKRTGDTFTGYSSPDGITWTERGSEEAAGIPNQLYIGFAVTSNVGGKRVTAVFDEGPVEASNPTPADGARNVELPMFKWTPGVTALFHDLYLGTTPTLGPDEHIKRLPVTQAMYFHDPGFVPETTYYWRVDETNMDETTIHVGDVWTFTSAPTRAYAPQPWDGARWVEVETDLRWTPGTGAITHDVYFGADKTAVEARDPSTFKGNRTVITYNPGTLAENTTYYWRIDEHAEDDVIHEGKIWSFTTFGPGAGVNASYFEGTDLAGVPVLTQIEDSIDHNWSTGEVAAGLNDGLSARWTANLEAPFTETYQLTTTTDDGVRLWLDGRLLIDNWTNHSSTEDIAKVDLVAGQFYSLKMEWYESTGSAVARLWWQSPSIPRQIIPTGWLQLPVRATNPYPYNTDVNVPQTPILTWSASETAAQHDVYFGDDAEAVAAATPTDSAIYRGRQALDTTNFDPGPLEWNKTYYWRVDEVNDANPESPWQGCLWSFTTADFIVVDDFETYTNDSPHRVFQAWVDGLGFSPDDYFPDGDAGNGTGAAVGHDIWSADSPHYEGSIMEIDDVHGGYQAMPVYYDNSATPYYSEAERTWATPQNWTINDVNTLTLYVRGVATNDAAPLYVALEDSSARVGIVTHSDAEILTVTEWAAWEIPLSDFTDAGVAVTAVKRMAIGVGSRTATTPGGAGVLYVDDIRVVAP